jgi:hypothetical protein
MSNSSFGSGSGSYGQFWFGGSSFPGFLYKRNLGVGGRRSTKMAPGGNITCNSSTYLYNKYKPGAGGVGASSTSNRRAKNRLATVCSGQQCFPCYPTLGQYSNYTGNPNGFIPCPYIPPPPTPPPPPSYSATGIYTVSFDLQYNTIITFTGDGSITFTSISSVQYLLVGGGGGGGATSSLSYGGGGGGQVKIGIFNIDFETFNITIGSGGAGRSNATGLNGSNSSIISTSSTITSLGGFGSIANGNGGNSGAGGAGGTFYNGFPPAPSTINGVNGGGGAGGSGQQALAGNGSLNNVNSNYGGGGGGGSGNGFIFGGIGVGGGGNGGDVSSNGQNATPNTGGGGGGGGNAGFTLSGGNGGSGVCIFYFNV